MKGVRQGVAGVWGPGRAWRAGRAGIVVRTWAIHG